jgi:hypothetical protein
VPPAILTVGVGHEEQALSLVRRADAVCSEYGVPAGVALAFQVCVNKIEPAMANRCRNLLSKHNRRAALADEMEPRWPEMPLIVKPSAFTCRAERLARATASPHGSIVRPSGKTKGVAPDSDPCEEVALRIASKIAGSDILDAPFVNIARRDMSSSDEIAQPLRAIPIYFVVIGAHAAASFADFLSGPRA